MIEFYITVILTTTVLIAFLILVGYISGKLVSLIIIKGYSLIKKIKIFSGYGLHNIHYEE